MQGKCNISCRLRSLLFEIKSCSLLDRRINKGNGLFGLLTTYFENKFEKFEKFETKKNAKNISHIIRSYIYAFLNVLVNFLLIIMILLWLYQWLQMKNWSINHFRIHFFFNITRLKIMHLFQTLSNLFNHNFSLYYIIPILHT